MTLALGRKMTASKAVLLVHASEDKLYELWEIERGLRPPPDLRDVYEVEHGAFLENFVIDSVEKIDRWRCDERQRHVVHPTLPDISATLDAVRVVGDDEVVETLEVKVLSPHRKPYRNELDGGFLEYYAPQVAVQIACRPADRGMLVVQQGNSPPTIWPVNISQGYTERVIDWLLWFQHCVDSGEAPVPAPPKPVLPEEWISVDLDTTTDQSNWVQAIKPTLERWRETRDVWSQHEEAKADIKLFLPERVGTADYQGIRIKRARNGAVSIRELAA